MKDIVFKNFNSVMLLIITVILLSCSKGNDNENGIPDVDDIVNDNNAPENEYYVRFKLDGNELEYRAGVGCSFNYNGEPKYFTDVFGSKNSLEGLKNTLLLLVGGTERKMETDTPYNIFYNDSTKAPILISIAYYDENSNYYLTMTEEMKTLLGDGITDAELVFTQVTDKIVKGTFSGTLYYSGTFKFEDTLKITEGEFYAERD